jgi:hypothetical protein
MHQSLFTRKALCFDFKIAFLLLALCFPALPSSSSPYIYIYDKPEETKVPVRFIKKIEHKSTRLNKRVQRAKKKYLRELNKDEKRMQNKLCKLNPVLSDYLFRYPLATNLKLREKLKGGTQNSSEYFAMLDSMEVAVNYIEKKNAETGAKDLEVKHSEKAKQNILEAKKTLNEMSGIQQYLRTRKKQLNASLKKYPELSGDLMSYDKSTYYFREQVNEYKNIFKDPSHIEGKVFDQLRRDNSFGSYMKDNSELSKIFNPTPALPKGDGAAAASGIPASVPGLSSSDLSLPASGLSPPSSNQMQTIAQTEQMIQSSIKELGHGAKEIIEKNMGDMHSKMAKLKYGFPNLTNPADIPNFKPNPLKTKRFIDRFEYGMDFQFGSVN